MFCPKIFRSPVSKSVTRSILSVRYASSKTTPLVVGIDLGTTNSAVAIVRNSTPEIIESDSGERTIPSVVAFVPDNDTFKALVGAPAIRQRTINGNNTFSATKRLIGKQFSDPEVQRDVSSASYSIVSGPDGAAWVQTSYGKYSPAEIGAFTLKHMKNIAESRLNQPVRHAVVTVPAYFNDLQRSATKEAGRRAGLDVLRVLNEPTAAALAYGIGSDKNGLVAVYDLGGGTFDISVLDIADGVFEVVATAGDTHLGGEDFDSAVFEFVCKSADLNLTKDASGFRRVYDACVAARVELSTQNEARIAVPFVTDNVSLDVSLTREQLETLVLPLIDRTETHVFKVLRDAELEPSDIDKVLLVGGMTRMPKVRQAVASMFPEQPIAEGVDPDEAVALGAAIQAAILSGEIKDVLLLDVTPLTLGIETYGGIFAPLIPRNTTIPISKTEVFSTGVDGQTSVDISVYQGERPLVNDNKLIGDFKLGNIPVLPKGEPQIEVTFDIDADGILEVKARELKTGAKASITVTAGLSEEEAHKMVQEAELNKEADKKRSVVLEHATRSEMLVNDTENALVQLGPLVKKADDKLLEPLNGLLAEVKLLISNARQDTTAFDVQQLKDLTDKLQKESLNVYKELAKLQNS